MILVLSPREILRHYGVVKVVHVHLVDEAVYLVLLNDHSWRIALAPNQENSTVFIHRVFHLTYPVLESFKTGLISQIKANQRAHSISVVSRSYSPILRVALSVKNIQFYIFDYVLGLEWHFWVTTLILAIRTRVATIGYWVTAFVMAIHLPRFTPFGFKLI